MFFRTQRTLSENILMIFDPLPVKFLPQKKLLIWAKNSPIFCSKLPRSQKWRYQKFLLHQKMAKEGSKNQKNFIFSKSIFERWKKQILGPLGPFLAKIDFWWHVGDIRPYPPTPGDRHTVTSLTRNFSDLNGRLLSDRECNHMKINKKVTSRNKNRTQVTIKY